MRFPLLRFLSSAAAFVAALGLGILALHQLWPRDRQVAPFEAKFRQLAPHRGEYDTLFLGSSRVYRHADPVTFDAATAALGHPTHSFNFGMDGMFQPEDSFIFDRIMALRLPRLRQVFVEVSPFIRGVQDVNINSTRSVAWHDWRRTLFLCETYLARAGARGKKQRWSDRWQVVAKAWPWLQPHLWCFIQHETNLGAGAAMMGELLTGEGNTAPILAEWLGPARDGFSGLTAPPAPDLIAKFERERAALRVTPASDRALDPAGQHLLGEVVRRIRAAGAKPVLLVAPTSALLRFHPEPDLGVPLFNFADPDRWPALFETGHRQDNAHLNLAGARIFSRELAEEWVRSEFGDRGK